MKVTYTLHAEDKLKRPDIKKFMVNKKLIEMVLSEPALKSTTKYGDLTAQSSLDNSHDLRIIYVIIKAEIKVITFHISKKGRYK